jgi:hypothetical protein
LRKQGVQEILLYYYYPERLIDFDPVEQPKLWPCYLNLKGDFGYQPWIDMTDGVVFPAVRMEGIDPFYVRGELKPDAQ